MYNDKIETLLNRVGRLEREICELKEKKVCVQGHKYMDMINAGRVYYSYSDDYIEMSQEDFNKSIVDHLNIVFEVVPAKPERIETKTVGKKGKK